VLGLDKDFVGVFSTGFGLEDQILTLTASSGCQGAVLVFNSSEGVKEKALHLGGGAGDGRWNVGGVVGDGKCLMVSMTNFQDTAFVLCSGFISVFVREMNFNTSELVFEAAQDAVKIGFDQVGEFFVHRDVFVTADLNLHSLNSFSLTCPVRRMECRWSGGFFARKG
jgi:hypothetical protein